MTTWCRVRDLTTRHHFDIPLSRLAHLEAVGAVREIPGRRHGGKPRPPKHFRSLAELTRKPKPPAGRPADTRRTR